jgi:hypothetical protein
MSSCPSPRSADAHVFTLQSWAAKIAAAVAAEDKRDGLGNGALPSYQVRATTERKAMCHCAHAGFGYSVAT